MDLAQLLIDRAGIDAGRVDAALRRAIAQGRPFVREVVESGLCSEERVAELAVDALGTVLVEVDRGEVDRESVELVPIRLARRHLFVPVSVTPGGEGLRVAFADPFDEEAREALRRATGLGVEPLVATVSAVLDALDRAYAEETEEDGEGLREPAATPAHLERGDTRVIPRARELAPEATRRVERRASRTTTAPVHRLEDEATPEQRHEALLLALIEAGALSRADYLEALRRLLGRE
ncbi:MAG TPA: hypothetical protein RMH85_28940 [Polyangiaceae bacterium LLY-WYZ-15_(1-7)]|mgnify:CR=1 FL=1|nr:hypothetical protein [Sandaracinus sp.]HJL12542.1 hypothetical protein [Polyangiaceae bacterium LLY-WYZ-15_(1-7)]HJL23646.1 hypothetical protein [Polyangiaceae bacterium LLY-WYZ-15_(1-7)]HJL31052.1 hypothetical protein [Polyangiaceae bacterium LLY-WYZ-15_(1-7)]HJL39349.1 hypothetical protein [Polyangiaceae bacterium LLY-WYZ-15_(1-7)]